MPGRRRQPHRVRRAQTEKVPQSRHSYRPPSPEVPSHAHSLRAKQKQSSYQTLRNSREETSQL